MKTATLGPEEVDTNHPFTHPDGIPTDLNTLRFMADQLYLFLENPHLYSEEPRPIILHQPRRDNWTYRMVIVEPEQILGTQELIFVGFLGQRQSNADRVLADQFDEILVSEIPDHEGLLAYSTMALISGNFSNLVVFNDPEVKVQWSRSRAHAEAVDSLAPNYYQSVRLYNGRLPKGLSDSTSMYLERIKYFDYQVEPLWHGVREFEVNGRHG